ncbi:hypothetical protein N7U66_20360 [Lacinutrix neustonica]|uniref:CarboxypepD_reg-like domain-containing protein n=1 Tax=Lacinutrix neustonica TaxID=2980107 RepID=A0A9E8MW20_9FLAO|nr:hypothetical protein [Lacinutrix neustonica]WAC02101.1 hypothetical protein N7U66_20360 [Lacinutrix neustonica]
MKKVLYLSILLFPLCSFSQTLKGIIYHQEATADNIKIENLSKNSTVFSNENGEFEIEATVNDSIVFSALFYETKTKVVTQKQLEALTVFELKQTTNRLEEVILTDVGKEKPFSETQYKGNLNLQMQNDIKNNPHLYGKSGNGSLDFVAIAKLIGKLFKRKNTPETKAFISYYDIKTLFQTDAFFNHTLLTKTLNIVTADSNLFFEYIEVQNINNKLLSKDNKLLLLDALITYSHSFIAIVSEFKAAKTN